MTYATDFRGWPIPIDPNPYYKLRFGWGGVHWFGENDSPNVGGLYIIPRDRPLNSYLGQADRIQTRAAVFRCPLDTGAHLAASRFRPWDAAADLSLAPPQDRGTCFARSGTSYEANEWMYCRAGAVNGFGFAPAGAPYPNFRWRQSAEHIAVAPSSFVLLGDIGAMTAGRIGEAQRQNRDEFCAWWHGFEVGQLGFADGSVRLARMGTVTTPRYTFYLDPSRQPIGSRVFAYTW